jgi:hypothetical protein
VRWAPSGAIVHVERALGAATPGPIRDEVVLRLEAGALNAGATSTAIGSLIHDLRSDNTPGNAGRAGYLLAGLGRAALPALERALASEDWQERQLAAAALRHIPWYDPSDRMLRVTVEGLRDDDLPMERASPMLRRRGAYTGVANACDGVAYLVDHPGGTGPILRAGMEKGDPQQRLLCAVVAGRAGMTELLPVAAPILIEHLRANHIAGDAKLATPALLAFGEGVVPLLGPVLDSPDRQQRELARLVLIDLGAIHPPDADERFRLVRITCRALDPATGLDLCTEDLE